MKTNLGIPDTSGDMLALVDELELLIRPVALAREKAGFGAARKPYRCNEPCCDGCTEGWIDESRVVQGPDDEILFLSVCSDDCTAYQYEIDYQRELWGMDVDCPF